MSLSTAPLSVPIQLDEYGTARVGGTRVTLHSVIAVFKQGASPEGIVESFPTLDLSDVYTVLTYYLRNRKPVDEYLEEQGREAEAIRIEMDRRFGNIGLRERLLARKRARDAENGPPAS
jgi:uncharacterized protein (DUF433 family)